MSEHISSRAASSRLHTGAARPTAVTRHRGCSRRQAAPANAAFRPAKIRLEAPDFVDITIEQLRRATDLLAELLAEQEDRP